LNGLLSLDCWIFSIIIQPTSNIVGFLVFIMKNTTILPCNLSTFVHNIFGIQSNQLFMNMALGIRIDRIPIVKKITELLFD